MRLAPLAPRLVLFACALVVAPLAGITGCRSKPSTGAQQPYVPLTPIPLRVQNDNFLDMNVYVVSHGAQHRVGTVSGNGAANFSIDRQMVMGDDFSLLATPIGGRGRATTNNLTVGEGQAVEFHVATVLRQSTVIVR
jgi:hypothetical protein